MFSTVLEDSPQATPQHKDVPSAGAIRFAAMNYLARREHSQNELRQKLAKRFAASELLEAVLQQLKGEGLQSDQRFTQSFVAARMRKGQGPVRIANELRQKGVAPDLVEAALDLDEQEWNDLASSVLDKKYRRPFNSIAEKAKQGRFLQYRGFTGDQIRQALKRSADVE